MRWNVAPLVLAVALPACQTGKSMVDVGPDIESARATVSGNVYAADGSTPLPGRTIEAVSADGRSRITATSSGTGGYTIQVPEGSWRFQLVVAPGESIVKSPGTKELRNSEIETGEDFVVDGGA